MSSEPHPFDSYACHTSECEPDSDPLKAEHHIQRQLPRDHQIIEGYTSKLLETVQQDKRTLNGLSPPIVQFKELIDNNPILRKGFTEMFNQVPCKPPYDLDPTLKPQVRDYDTMFKAFDYIITHAIPYDESVLGGFPFNAILNWPMGTNAGLYTFLMPEVNAQFKNMFDEWSKFLSSPESRTYLTTKGDGWFGPRASTHMPNFVETYKCDPSAEYYGFKSWDDFFTREFRDGARPVRFPDPENQNIITSACESKVYKIAYDVKERDQYWIKGEQYSLRDMLNNDLYTDQFVGGTIYQAFLGTYKYHRWASPVTGIIDRVEIIPGTYFAQSPVMGFDNPGGPDPAAPIWSQAYISAIASRALVWIKANNPDIGVLGFLAVGMSEVSTCEVTVKAGDNVSKGDQLGMFHFGGSTYCLIFRNGVKVAFDVAVGDEPLLNQRIATVGGKS
ncbi:unnamed protein product [Rhizoctonia solani]|uniref:L-tryptophan decarboxylase PsiD-like domain-containing protein n=1 Tax=Rhizoctonia solani TaxID=456999 RepID=A0A8H2XA84_9AGAM|nr:unnamed protein product [Rhizoctonia solani]